MTPSLPPTTRLNTQPLSEQVVVLMHVADELTVRPAGNGERADFMAVGAVAGECLRGSFYVPSVSALVACSGLGCSALPGCVCAGFHPVAAGRH